jgi:hypothetical protein
MTDPLPDLPEDLAPALRDQIRQLLTEVPLARRPEWTPRRRHANGRPGPKCVICHQGGRVGGHHLPDGTVVWVHKSCHRRHHRAENRRGKTDKH